MVSRSTGPAIRTGPPAHATSTTPPLAGGECGGSAREGSASGTKAGAGGRSAEGACCRSSRRHRNKRLGVIPCRRATAEIEPVARCASSTMARFSHAAQDRRVLATTVREEAFGPDMSTIQVYPADPYRSHPNPSPTRRPRPDAYGAAAADRRRTHACSASLRRPALNASDPRSSSSRLPSRRLRSAACWRRPSWRPYSCRCSSAS